MRFAWLLVLPFACVSLAADEADGAVAALMRRAAPKASHVQVLTRAPAEAALDLVVALGTERAAWPEGQEGGW